MGPVDGPECIMGPPVSKRTRHRLGHIYTTIGPVMQYRGTALGQLTSSN